MGEWVIGALINIVGSIAINFGTNLLKLGHDQRERLSTSSNDGTNGKLVLKPIIHFQSWRIGILFFAVGNCLNFFSFAYAAQSLLAALGSVQFVSNIAFAYFVLSKTVTIKVMVATTFIVFGNIFLVSFGNHQSPVYTPEQLSKKYSNLVFLLYCLTLVLVVAINHYIYRKGEAHLSLSGQDFTPYWRMLLPFSYATVSGAVGSCSVLFAKSLSNMLRLTMSSNYQFHSWFTYSMLLLFFSTAGFWIAWTFFSICTGFIYFQEYQVFDTLRITMFILGMTFVFIGISLLAPDDTKGGDAKDSSSTSSTTQGLTRLSMLQTEECEVNDVKSFMYSILAKGQFVMAKAKAACSLSVGLGEETLNASSVLVMPMVSSRTTGFRGNVFDRAKFIPLRNPGRSNTNIDEDEDDDDDEDTDTRDSRLLLS
ncbi:putative magnesium transporter NIPA8 [Iris pallida]|uniref:Probable magnesium transporter n=1 Tax=Iris pallida TaxID=29817 RepID=A0AAX6DQ93_IRIPA|nr:putative magnesium transporter NIPA8 [Iris pallida]